MKIIITSINLIKILLLFLLFSSSIQAKPAEAIFASGCFWWLEADFQQLEGVLDTVAGFDGGTSNNPNYKQVTAGLTDYVQAVRVIYNPAEISYQDLVDFFWHHIDPTDPNGQFCNQGPQYRSVIFYLNNQQRHIALDSKKRLEKIFPKIYTDILPSTTFYAAEDYHQDFFENHPLRYKFTRYRCGRDKKLETLWSAN